MALYTTLLTLFFEIPPEKMLLVKICYRGKFLPKDYDSDKFYAPIVVQPLQFRVLDSPA